MKIRRHNILARADTLYVHIFSHLCYKPNNEWNHHADVPAETGKKKKKKKKKEGNNNDDEGRESDSNEPGLVLPDRKPAPKPFLRPGMRAAHKQTDPTVTSTTSATVLATTLAKQETQLSPGMIP